MSTRYEWIDADMASWDLHSRGEELGEHQVDEPFALALGGDSVTVVEGSEVDLRRLLVHGLRLLGDSGTVAQRILEQRIECPVHHMTDCSPLLNGCSLVIHLTAQRRRDAVLATRVSPDVAWREGKRIRQADGSGYADTVRDEQIVAHTERHRFDAESVTEELERLGDNDPVLLTHVATTLDDLAFEYSVLAVRAQERAAAARKRAEA